MFLRPLSKMFLGCSLAAVGACSSEPPSSANPGSSSTAGAGGAAGSSSSAGAGGAASGASGAGASGGGVTAPGSRPATESSASIASFLAAKTYESPPWVAETPMPREMSGVSSPHERVRVYFNDLLTQSFAAGNGSRESQLAHTTGSMAVKVLYDADTQVGMAASLKLEGPFRQWAYYCEGPRDRCATSKGPFTAADPLYGVGIEVDCGFCHDGVVFTPPPN
jgi:hypothetical protein